MPLAKPAANWSNLMPLASDTFDLGVETIQRLSWCLPSLWLSSVSSTDAVSQLPRLCGTGSAECRDALRS